MVTTNQLKRHKFTILIVLIVNVVFIFYLEGNKVKMKICASLLHDLFPNNGSSLGVGDENEIIKCSENGSEYIETTAKGLTVRYIRYPLDINFTFLVEGFLKHGSEMNAFVKPINVHRLRFLVSPLQKCLEDNIFLLYAVKSAPGNFERRKAIRETWGRENISEHYIVRTVFLLGISRNTTLENMLDKESAVHNDILKISYYDYYYNNTQKVMGGLNWVVHYCKTSKFVIFGDDDFYFGTKLILKYLANIPSTIYPSFFAGSIGNDIVERGEGGRWTLTYQQYPYFKYPPFLRAGAMIMSIKFAIKLQIASHFTKHLAFDDVFFGIVSCKLGISPINQTQISIWWKADYNNITAFKNVIASHHFNDPQEIRNAWKVHEMLNPY